MDGAVTETPRLHRQGHPEQRMAVERLVQMQELMHYTQYLDDPDEELQSELRYKIHCIENDIPYMGFFDRVYNPEKSFTLNKEGKQ